ncbi:CAF17-like 4Fe-4S cluster assembly/insertion protein YgfZ [Faucicola boevrei]|uniref:CAF17-like 4Fe-4S cluster assembly/insertion protein YgfZ n=1 Tax=Faucicola boevrei TaxID=346665 RepID=UPI000379FD9B|nr:folate-binding protein YgfZ [Moraxella boevrei]
MPNFVQFLLTGNAKSTDKLADTAKFLQGQLTANVAKITDTFLPTAICNLKGRVQFGLWLKQCENGYHIVLSSDLAEDFANHVKKYGAFSKVELAEKYEIFPTVVDNFPTFSTDIADKNVEDWQKISIEQGNYWLSKDSSELFQPQELRLHQRGGVDYDKGCYLGQEIVARLWFKASPKAWLHRVSLSNKLNEKVQIINQFNNQALVVARPNDLTSIEILPLPENLQRSVAREV